MAVRAATSFWLLLLIIIIQEMFKQLLELKAESIQERAKLQDLQYQIFSSYVRYASEQLALKEAQVMAQSELLLTTIASHHQDKTATQLSATQASLFNSRHFDEQSSNRSRQIRTAFKRKSKNIVNRQTKNTILDALQEIKEICSERTIISAENVFGEYQRMAEEQHFTDFREGVIKRRKQRCETCLSKESQLELRTQQYDEKILSLNIDIKRLQKKCEDQERKLLNIKNQQQEHAERQKAIFDNCRQYLLQKQTAITNKHNQLKLIEREICNAMGQVSQMDGCPRCQVIKAIKGQILEYRRYYERQYEKLQKLFNRYRKIFR